MSWRTAAGAFVIAVGAGLLLGVGGRIVMRLIAVAAGISPGFSIGGSLEVVATGILIGTPAALVWLVLRRLLGGGIWRGAAYGGLVLAVLTAVPPPAARSAFGAVDNLALTLGLFGPLFVIYGALVEVGARSLLTGGREQAGSTRIGGLKI